MDNNSKQGDTSKKGTVQEKRVKVASVSDIYKTTLFHFISITFVISIIVVGIALYKIFSITSKSDYNNLLKELTLAKEYTSSLQDTVSLLSVLKKEYDNSLQANVLTDKAYQSVVDDITTLFTTSKIIANVTVDISDIPEKQLNNQEVVKFLTALRSFTSAEEAIQIRYKRLTVKYSNAPEVLTYNMIDKLKQRLPGYLMLYNISVSPSPNTERMLFDAYYYNIFNNEIAEFKNRLQYTLVLDWYTVKNDV